MENAREELFCAGKLVANRCARFSTRFLGFLVFFHSFSWFSTRFPVFRLENLEILLFCESPNDNLLLEFEPATSFPAQNAS